MGSATHKRAFRLSTQATCLMLAVVMVASGTLASAGCLRGAGGSCAPLKLSTGAQSILGNGGKIVKSFTAEPTVERVTLRGGNDATVKTLLRFRINYKTRFGENVVLVGNLPDFGEVLETSVTNCVNAAAAGKGARMAYISDDNWGLDIALELEPGAQPPPVFRYRYVVVDDNKQHKPFAEAGSRDGRLLNLGGSPATYPSDMEVRDEWRFHQASIMCTSAFTSVIFNDPNRHGKQPLSSNVPPDSVVVRLVVDGSRVEKGHMMGIIGSCQSLGAWEDGKVVVMSGTNYPVWEADIVVKKSEFPLEYRYVIVDGSKKVQALEQGDDCRRVQLGDDVKSTEGASSTSTPGISGTPPGDFVPPVAGERNIRAIVKNDDLSFAKFPLYKSQWRGAGVALPVFGIRTNEGMGTGEFLDLKGVADWCAKTNMKVLHFGALFQRLWPPSS
jgi:4-alpha-glucanotransferase